MWLFKRRHTKPSEATRSREQAEQALAATRAETHRYRALGESLRQLRVENHFADKIADSFRGNP